MGRVFALTLEGLVYTCMYCGTHLANIDDLVSRRLYCKNGRAYLFSKVTNVTLGEEEERIMMTGPHIVADIFCVRCGSNVGWKYGAVHEESEKYKEGKSAVIIWTYGPLNPEANVRGSDTETDTNDDV